MLVIVTSLLISIYLKLIVFMHRVYIRFSNFFFFGGGGEGGNRGNTAPSRSIPDRILCLWYISGLLCNSLKIVARGHVSVDTGDIELLM